MERTERLIVDKVREQFGKNDEIRDKGLLIPEKIVRYDNIRYGMDEKWNLLDIYQMKGDLSPQPTIVSIHGGGWVYGDKERYQFYCMDLARRGYTVVNFSYRLAPEHYFPAALEDVNKVFLWIGENAEDYHIDLKNLFLAGDSAGAQLASQYMALLTNTDYQKEFDFQIPSDTVQIKAAALNCGVYDMVSYYKKEEAELFRIYLGTKAEKAGNKIDIMRYITKNFPPAYIMTAQYDMLKEYAEPMFKILQELGIQTEYHIYGAEGQRYMGHVFHLNLRLKEAGQCNDDECRFFQKYIS